MTPLAFIMASDIPTPGNTPIIIIISIIVIIIKYLHFINRNRDDDNGRKRKNDNTVERLPINPSVNTKDDAFCM